ncbi:hypothetical protein, partial [Paracoccus binzhouensis]|uniref:hypothetical protein n=1 Tax=Paracoccus binzhouensis TaxID=2796149 RepID=UPI001E3DE43F
LRAKVTSHVEMILNHSQTRRGILFVNTTYCNPLCDQFVVRPDPFDAKGRPKSEATIGRINVAGKKLSFINILFGASPDSFLPSRSLIEPIEGCIL